MTWHFSALESDDYDCKRWFLKLTFNFADGFGWFWKSMDVFFTMQEKACTDDFMMRQASAATSSRRPKSQLKTVSRMFVAWGPEIVISNIR